MKTLAKIIVAALLAIVAAGLFALQTDDRILNGFQITRGPGFYMQVSLNDVSSWGRIFFITFTEKNFS